MKADLVGDRGESVTKMFISLPSLMQLGPLIWQLDRRRTSERTDPCKPLNSQWREVSGGLRCQPINFGKPGTSPWGEADEWGWHSAKQWPLATSESK